MSDITRRKFLALGAKLAALMSLSPTLVPTVAEALTDLAAGRAPVLWLQGQSCSGCSISFLNSEYPDPAQILTGHISLAFHATLAAATGQTAMETINRSIDAGGYHLVVEGSIPAGMPGACRMGHELFSDLLTRAALQAKSVLAVGTCAAFGGIPSAENNPTGAESIPFFLLNQQIETPVIRIPGCPPHPDWIVGALVHLLKFGQPELDHQKRPKIFFDRILHDQCPRFADYEREKFAGNFSEPGCLFKLGCLGPITHADCTRRLWNGGINSCINAGGPCIGCTSPGFASSAAFPFYRKGESKAAKEGQG
jgi:hydrogenase small subunit